MDNLVSARLGDLVNVFIGGDAPKEYTKEASDENAVPIYSNGIEKEGLYGYTCSPKVEGDSVTISARGNVGAAFYRDKPFVPIVRLLALTPNRSLINAKYLYYLLKLDSIISTGAAQQQITAPQIKKHRITYYSDISYQNSIVAILSAYDSQIENNQKRIKLLEQMAENLYKEWFVRFRFPGYENAEFEGGVPKGWGKGSVATYAEIMSGGTPKTDVVEYYGGNIPFFTPKDATDGFFSCSTFTMITEDGLNHCNSRYYPKNTITITARGTVGRVNMMGVPMAMNQSCFALKSKYSGSNIYLFFALKEASAMMKKMASGGVFDTIVLKTFDHISILNPSVELLGQFDIIVSPILDTILMLQKNNDILTHQRDLLLPRLMSGKLSI